MKSQSTTIYALADDAGKMRYIGKTSRPLRARLAAHITIAVHGNQTHKCRWIRTMLSRGKLPSIMEIEMVSGDGAERETFWIAAFRAQGADLTNLTNGGEGAPGRVLTEDHKRKIGDANRGRAGHPHSAETRAKMSASRMGHATPEHVRAKISAANSGRKHSDETREKNRLGHLGLKASDETRARMRSAHAARRMAAANQLAMIAA